MSAVSILIRTRNESRAIRPTLDRVLSQSVTDKEVLVVDSGSTDGTVEMVRQYPVRLYEIPPEAFSYGYALNYGFERAEGDYVACLSAHALPASDRWLEILLFELSRDEKVAGVMGRNLPYPDCNPFDQRELLRPERNLPQDLMEKTPFTFSNANCLIRKEVWKRIPFSESLSYSEDKDWARKARTLGYCLRYEPSAAVYHSHDGSLKTVGREFYLSALAEREMSSNGRTGTVRLVSRGLFGTIADWGFILKRGFSVKWFLMAPFRRAVIVSARLKGVHGVPQSTHFLHLIFKRPFSCGLKD